MLNGKRAPTITVQSPLNVNLAVKLTPVELYPPRFETTGHFINLQTPHTPTLVGKMSSLLMSDSIQSISRFMYLRAGSLVGLL